MHDVQMFLAAGCLATGFVAASGVPVQAQDVAAGKALFARCSVCHRLDSNMIGPKLKGVIGRKAGSAEGFAAYSNLMTAAGEAGLVWTEAEIVGYLRNPTTYLTSYDKAKGKAAGGYSKMLFKLSSEQQRRDVAAYLASVK